MIAADIYASGNVTDYSATVDNEETFGPATARPSINLEQTDKSPSISRMKQNRVESYFKRNLLSFRILLHFSTLCIRKSKSIFNTVVVTRMRAYLVTGQLKSSLTIDVNRLHQVKKKSKLQEYR